MSHEDVQEFFRARYYLSPSLLYSIIRPDKHRSGYDVAVEGDWVTIAVIAERGKIQVSRGFTNNDDRLDEDEGAEDKPSKGKNKHHKVNDASKGGRKYVSIKLVDFGHRSKTGGKSSSSGDALLTLLLFEAETVSVAPKDPNGKVHGSTIYKGGSGGAFEELLPKLREGAVIAILNPRVLRPYQVCIIRLLSFVADGLIKCL